MSGASFARILRVGARIYVDNYTLKHLLPSSIKSVKVLRIVRQLVLITIFGQVGGKCVQEDDICIVIRMFVL